MAYLIIRIEPCENDTLPEREKEPTVAFFAVRHRAEPPEATRIAEVLDAKGFELGPFIGGTATKFEWPLTAYIYISDNSRGYGRIASTLHRWPVRKLD